MLKKSPKFDQIMPDFPQLTEWATLSRGPNREKITLNLTPPENSWVRNLYGLNRLGY